MSIPEEYRVSFDRLSLAELQAYGAYEIGAALNECIVALVKLAGYAQITRGELLEAVLNADKKAQMTLKNRMKDISEYQRVIRDSKSIFQSLVRSIP